MDDADKPFVTYSDLMAKVGKLLFYWSILEQGLTESITQARAATGQKPGRVCGTFVERIDTWSQLVTHQPGNENGAGVVAEIREQAVCLREIRNLIVHGMMAGNSMPDGRAAYIVCAVGGYDNPTGQTIKYSIDELEHFAQAADSCRRGFMSLDAFNYRLDPLPPGD